MSRLFEILNQKSLGSNKLNIQKKYKELLFSAAEIQNTSINFILEEGIKLYCDKHNINQINNTPEEVKIQDKFIEDLAQYLDKNLLVDSGEYRETVVWCERLRDVQLSENVLDLLICNMIAILYKKTKLACKEYYISFKIDRRMLQRNIIKLIEEREYRVCEAM